jgi:2-polyprenyl-6-hydroxyphenyl methylase/3-demethylubiquinone-9 3-methyltransferase
MMQDRPEIRFHDEISEGWETRHQTGVFRSRTASMLALLGQSGLEQSRLGQSGLAGQHWLDAGCGTGTLSRRLAARGCRVTGVDASAKMIAIARAQREDTAGICEFTEIPTIESLPFTDQSFDGVLCASVLEYVPDLGRCLSETHRVLRPQGLFLLSIPNRRSSIRMLFKAGFRLSSKILARPVFRYLEFSKHDASLAEARLMLESHGFTLLSHDFAGSPLPRPFSHWQAVGTLINLLARKNSL